jgi:protein phosphatase 1 regulatory subunit 7
MESSTATDLDDELDPSSTILDLTSYQLHNLDSVELPSNLTELDLTANRLSTLDPRIAQLSDLKKLSLRQNLITDSGVEPLSSWNALSYLEVYSFSLRFSLKFCLDAFEFLKRNVFIDLFDVGTGVT